LAKFIEQFHSSVDIGAIIIQNNVKPEAASQMGVTNIDVLIKSFIPCCISIELGIVFE
jgi:hypothetical protein